MALGSSPTTGIAQFYGVQFQPCAGEASDRTACAVVRTSVTIADLCAMIVYVSTFFESMTLAGTAETSAAPHAVH